MKTTMTESDKRLLMFMFLFVIIVAISYWGIYPQVKRYRALEAKIEKEEDDKKINQMKIANLGLIEMQAEEYEGKISEKKDEFYQIMKSSEVDKMMTELATSNGLDIYELNFTMPSSPTERMAYQYSELYKRQMEMKAEYEASESSDMDTDTAATTAQTTDEEEGEEDSDGTAGTTGAASGSGTAALMEEMMGAEEGGYQPNTDIYAVPVTMTVGGDLENLQKFINNIIAIDKRVLLVGYSWGEFRDVIRRDANGNIIRSSSGNSADGTVTSSATAAVSGDDAAAEDATNVQIEVVTRKSLTVRLEIYMCDTASIEQSVNGPTDAEEADGAGEEGESSEEGTGDSENGTTLDELDDLLEE
ncbi:MAG: hypothetical protein IKS48_09180 [Eubacterium sp.]|nr:hypothetical protein [Eubacterium sp.]